MMEKKTMNKLYIIKFYLKSGFILETMTFWNLSEMENTMRLYKNWKYTVTENNSVHMIVKAI